MAQAALSSPPLPKDSHVRIFTLSIIVHQDSAELPVMRDAAMRTAAAILKRPAAMKHPKAAAAVMKGSQNWILRPAAQIHISQSC
jgi:hypothetical protein